MLLSAEEWASAPPDVADREWRLVSHAIVDDEAGETLALGRTTAGAAVRRLQGGRPETDWNRSYTFGLAGAPLTRGDLIAAGRGR